MKIIIDNPRLATVCGEMSLLYDLKHNKDQLKKLVEDCLYSKSLIAEEIKVV
jgi:hypothetical protein